MSDVIQRYEMGEYVMYKEPSGDWIKYADHCAHAAALQAENARLREQLEQLAKFLPRPQRPEMEG